MKHVHDRIYPIKIPISEYPEFCNRLKCAMTLRNISPPDLASRLYITRSTVSGYRSGLRQPSCDILRRLAQELDVSTDYLLGLSEYIYISLEEKQILAAKNKKEAAKK